MRVAQTPLIAQTNIVRGALKSREWTSREWTSRHQVARVDIAGVDIAGVIGSRKLSCSLLDIYDATKY